MDMKLEVVVLPVSDVDRAKDFYLKLGWREDADFPGQDGFRVVQLTPPGSPASVIFGDQVSGAEPGSVQGLHLVVSDIDKAHAELVELGIEVGPVFHDRDGVSPTPTARRRSPARTRSGAATPPSPRSATPTATPGCCRRSPLVYPVGSEVRRIG
jgi:catechol 2,3-dioxygenase-like lactoylglutathione lyase family enzyme